ncbi:hypothetical protein JXM67_08930 [candidate division WOR-3 bacterium]|nr:hypothetical protein [candidate division WOR-3 bacterium]
MQLNNCQNRNGTTAVLLIGIMLIATTVVAESPASISLKLGKDTLALAEPVYLTATITNHLDKSLILDDFEMFRLDQLPYRFSLFLITPSGEEWPYVGARHRVFVTYAASVKHWLLLPSNTSATKGMLVWWTTFVPWEYQTALENLLSGTYKLFAIYELPEQQGLPETVVYSDTIELTFLPLEWQHRTALLEMDSLRDFFNTGGRRSTSEPGLLRIVDSKTPYSEAAYAVIMATWCLDPDSFSTKKDSFNSQYPESQFESYLLNYQYNGLNRASSLAKQYNWYPNLDVNLVEKKLDSLDSRLLEIEPNHSSALLRLGIIKHPAKLEDVK